ncbi:helix-turn-helix domain-containing protein [Streptomyces sp. NPDC014646]|uniref:helix-turn-helix domain-containing protein n=1 Tax=Streptomyces sp. NPDC014646 TaxID=3364877 RepID=UPI0036F605BC
MAHQVDVCWRWCGTAAPLCHSAGRRTDLATGRWQHLLAYDEQHGTDYAKTLVRYFGTGCDMAGAARLLAAHPHTCRCRLKQARHHLPIDRTDHDEMLVLRLHPRTPARLRVGG